MKTKEEREFEFQCALTGEEMCYVEEGRAEKIKFAKVEEKQYLIVQSATDNEVPICMTMSQLNITGR